VFRHNLSQKFLPALYKKLLLSGSLVAMASWYITASAQELPIARAHRWNARIHRKSTGQPPKKWSEFEFDRKNTTER
jgi:hypothetical protein